ncbi:hypothetical protein MJO28_013030 [Puccinia striiformis f. sp. tritici]|uniref:Uncharacterized protein n=1 Tax=Puccinia striiformis f. sp. tritici TaxID=168172 RepID=A0ACC0DY97_9BASI|nr:hypothetical protein MJO28_013030 [Puccinia striiformis f. sp. tritici]
MIWIGSISYQLISKNQGQISCFIWLHEWSNLIATLDETREFSFRRRLQVQGFLDNLVGLINPIQSHSGKGAARALHMAKGLSQSKYPQQKLSIGRNELGLVVLDTAMAQLANCADCCQCDAQHLGSVYINGATPAVQTIFSTLKSSKMDQTNIEGIDEALQNLAPEHRAAYVELINNSSRGGFNDQELRFYFHDLDRIHFVLINMQESVADILLNLVIQWSTIIASLDETRESSFRRRLQVQGFLDNLVLLNPIRSQSEIDPSLPDDCPICQEQFSERLGAAVVQLPCHSSHTYHRDCIQEWLQENSNCPLCRFELPIRQQPGGVQKLCVESIRADSIDDQNKQETNDHILD